MIKEYYSEDGNESVEFDDLSISMAESYWTEDRMKNAVPDKFILPGPPPFPNPETPATIGNVSEADINSPPFDAGGKLFFTKQGQDFVASGQFCGNRNIILTAAHCVRDRMTGEWSDNLVFRRGYKLDFTKQTCVIRTVTIRKEWYEIKDPCWDFAFIISNAKSLVQPLFHLINSPFSTVTAFGYPTNFSYGLIMQKVNGPTEKFPGFNKVRMTGNPMGGGCSGGAWIEPCGDDISGFTVYISGLNSHSYEGPQQDMYSPLFNSYTDSLFNYAQKRIPANTNINV